MNGYEALRTKAAWFDISGRGLIRITGDDRARLLHAMSTNDINRLKTGDGCYVFFLNAQGRILADSNVYAFEDSLLLDTEPETGPKVQEHLDKYIIADDATLADETNQWRVIAVEGPESPTIAEELGITVPAARGIAEWNGGFVANVSVTGVPSFRLFIYQNEQLPDFAIPQASPEEVKAVRLEHGTPRYGEDITERFLVQETNQIQAVSFSKGCYLGQEIVERVRSRAQIHRILHALRINSDTPPEPGTKLTQDDKPAGEITSAAFSPALGRVVALGYVRIDLTQTNPALQLANGLTAELA